MRISKWRNSLVVRLPAAVVEALELKEGDDIDVLLADHPFAPSSSTGDGRATAVPKITIARKPARKRL